MPATLHVVLNGREQPFELSQIITIGRAKENNIVLPDPKASRTHAIVRCLGDGSYYVVDAGSSNGTLLNNQPVTMPGLLKDSDEIRIGSHVLRFHLVDEPSPALSGEESDVADATAVTIGGALHEITILVADVRNFTPLSQRIPIVMLTNIMSRLFRGATEIVEARGGIVDKFIGDAVMVRWVAAQNCKIADTIVSALRSACEMNTLVGTLNQEFPGLPIPLAIGVGINSGLAVLGNIGMSNRRDFTALGDSVNLAFHCETLTKTLGRNVVIGPDAYGHLPEKFWKGNIQAATVKGKENSIDVCAVNFDEICSGLPCDATPPT